MFHGLEELNACFFNRKAGDFFQLLAALKIQRGQILFRCVQFRLFPLQDFALLFQFVLGLDDTRELRVEKSFSLSQTPLVIGKFFALVGICLFELGAELRGIQGGVDAGFFQQRFGLAATRVFTAKPNVRWL